MLLYNINKSVGADDTRQGNNFMPATLDLILLIMKASICSEITALEVHYRQFNLGQAVPCSYMSQLQLCTCTVKFQFFVPPFIPYSSSVIRDTLLLHLYITLQVLYIGMELHIFTSTFISFGMLSLYLFRYIISAFYFLVCVPFCHVNLSYHQTKSKKNNIIQCTWSGELSGTVVQVRIIDNNAEVNI